MKAHLAKSTTSSIKQYVQSDKWWAEQKLDGQRFLVQVEDGVVTAWNREGVELTMPDSLAADFSDGSFSKKKWLFDGELLDDGSYYVFDLLHAGTEWMIQLPLEQRRKKLENIFELWSPVRCFLTNTAKTETEKAELVTRLDRECAEGVVFKSRYGIYTPGKKTNEMIKFKFVSSADVVVMELEREDKPQAITIGMYDDRYWPPNKDLEDRLVEVSGCKIPFGVQLEVNDVIEVRYLYATADDKLTQPTFVRRRTDKEPLDCTMRDQLKYTSKAIW